MVFIVDTQFDSIVYRDKAMSYVRQYHDNALTEKDYFGYISLDDSKQAALDEIILEPHSANKKLKQTLLKDIARREVDYVFASGGNKESSKSIRLERALELAYEW